LCKLRYPRKCLIESQKTDARLRKVNVYESKGEKICALFPWKPIAEGKTDQESMYLGCIGEKICASSDRHYLGIHKVPDNKGEIRVR